MKVSQVNGFTRVGEIGYKDKAPRSIRSWYHYDTKLNIILDKDLDKKLYATQMAIVYLFVVNGEIVKIGQTGGKGGMKGCLNFYLGAGFGADGPPRFNINALVRECLERGDKVEIYYTYTENYILPVRGLISDGKVECCVGAKEMESLSLTQYKGIEGDYPEWNYQERGVECPRHIVESYNTFRVNRQVR